MKDLVSAVQLSYRLSELSHIQYEMVKFTGENTDSFIQRHTSRLENNLIAT